MQRNNIQDTREGKRIAKGDSKNLNACARAEKYAKSLAKTSISPEGDSANHRQNAYFYDAAVGILAAVVLMLSAFLPPEKTVNAKAYSINWSN